MIPFVVDKGLLGTTQHLYVTDGYSWIDEVPADVWYLNGQLKTQHRCLDTLVKLEHHQLDVNPPERYYNSMMLLMSGSPAWPPPWPNVMPRPIFKGFVETLVQRVAEFLAGANKDYYDRVWVPGSEVLDVLQPAMVDRSTWEKWMTEAASTTSLKTFEPNAAGMLPKAIYDRFGTRTGRPTITSGPSILVLKREHRNVLTSRWGKAGKIVMLDFSALEIRVLLYECGQRCDNPDLYEELNQLLFQGRSTRKIVKGAVICDMYGQSKFVLGQKLGIQGRELDVFLERVRIHFKTARTLKSIKQQFVDTGFVLNRYGRRIPVEVPVDHMLLNSYAQSTGIDVAMIGFRNIIKQVSSSPRIVPIFLLTDAILFDCHNDEIETLKALKHVTVSGYVQPWPLRFFERIDE